MRWKTTLTVKSNNQVESGNSVLIPNTPLADEVECAYVRIGLVGHDAHEAVPEVEECLPYERLGHRVCQL